MVAHDIVELSKEDLFRVLEAVRALASKSAGTDVEGLLSAAIRIATRLTDSDAAAIFRLEEATSTLVLVGHEPHNGRLTEMFGRMSLTDSWTGRSLVNLETTSEAVRRLPP